MKKRTSSNQQNLQNLSALYQKLVEGITTKNLVNFPVLTLFRVYANTNVKSNPELLAKINEVTRKNAVIKDFETAVSEFYASIRQFESMK